MEPATMMLVSSLISGAFTAGSGILGASNSRNQASRSAKAQQKANEISRYNRARLMAYQDDQRIKLHNYKVDAYKRFIPRAFDRANLAYQDNNAALTELIDQYQFQGQDRLAESVAQRGALAARGITGRGAMTQDVALDSALGRGDQMMSRNLLAARYGTDRANMKIRQQLTDSLQNAYNQVGYTPERTPAGLLGAEMPVGSSFNNNDFNAGAFGAALQGFGTAAAGAVSAAAYPKPTADLPPVPELTQFQGPFIPGQQSTYLPGPINTKLPNL
jgi:hypothetical protein